MLDLCTSKQLIVGVGKLCQHNFENNRYAEAWLSCSNKYAGVFCTSKRALTGWYTGVI